MYIFLLIFALVILFIVGSATALRYFDNKHQPTQKNDANKEP